MICDLVLFEPVTAFCTVRRPLLHFHTRFSSYHLFNCLPLSLPSPLFCVWLPLSPYPFSPFLPSICIPFFSSLSTSFCKVARTPVLCGFWALWSPFVTSSGTTTAGWSSRSWAWYCCCSCWASSSTQSLATWSRRYWGPDELVASAPSSLSLLIYLTPLLPGFSCRTCSSSSPVPPKLSFFVVSPFALLCCLSYRIVSVVYPLLYSCLNLLRKPISFAILEVTNCLVWKHKGSFLHIGEPPNAEFTSHGMDVESQICFTT